MRAASSPACLSPLLLCLCVLQRSYGTPSPPSPTFTHNQTKLPDSDKDSHYRPKRGWIWNQFFVLEEHIGPDAQYVGKLHSNSDKGDGSVQYLLSGEGAGTIFTINELTGEIHAKNSLDREKKSHYVLHARAVDRFTNRAVEPESEFIIKVQDVNDNAPKFPDGPFSASVPEMADIGTSVFQITATDADDPTYGNSAKIVYSILQGQPFFTVDPKTGVIRTALPNMDRETREMYSVIIQAKDMAGSVGGLSGSTTVNISLADVNDNPPRFPQSTSPCFSLSLSPWKKSLDFSKQLLLSLRRFNLNKPCKLAERKQHFLIFASKDFECLIKSHLFCLCLSSTSENYQLYVPESAQVGKAVGKIKANDEDLEGDALFTIDVDSGLITTTKSLDREEVAWHNITVMASETGMYDSEVIQTIRATDKDNFANGRFTFALPEDLPANPNFTLKDNEGQTLSTSPQTYLVPHVVTHITLISSLPLLFLLFFFKYHCKANRAVSSETRSVFMLAQCSLVETAGL
uniref:Cadherin-18-like n=1 Tax=Sinocyclocheilus anshuiensis TaxID=1608454 RepID=A0A671K2D2_9TELE